MKDTLSGVLQKESYKYIRRAAIAAVENEEAAVTLSRKAPAEAASFQAPPKRATHEAYKLA